MLNGAVTVPEMLAARDHRVELQQDFIARFHHPVICFMLNIPGPHKVGEDFYWAFRMISGSKQRRRKSS